jgi:hypothetical protein
MGFAPSALMLSKLYSNALMASLNSRTAARRFGSPFSFDRATYGTTQQFTTVQLGITSVGNPSILDDTESGNGIAAPDTKSGSFAAFCALK